MLRNTKEARSLKENLMLASSTAFVAGIINVAGLIAFFAFSSNITGHVANLAKNIVDFDLSDVISLSLWLLAFFSGAFVSSYIIRSYNYRSQYRAHSLPIVIETVVLFMVALYGNHIYKGSQQESEVIIGFILFSMGLQNGMVSIISGGLVKSSHLTGLITDMGAEAAEYIHPKSNQPAVVKNKLYVRVTILSFYILGGLVGAYFFYLFKFKVFYVAPAVLLTILAYDLLPLFSHRIASFFKPAAHKGK
ncbi:YoaK family protein [Pedobacter sp. L105]|uniref:YoaK family protein n=1 Tax=Pedobacter sp. L105 TaxID=1641871 RepID=UPI00131C3BCE|nr:YoaK family protein [Pedobacter sp. L105]